MKVTKVGVIGMGCRGFSMMKSHMLKMPNVKIVAVCDKYQDRADKACDAVLEASGEAPTLVTTEAAEVINCPEVEAVIVFTSWDCHVDYAIDAMNAGKPVAMEVGGAYTLEECFELVETYEKTGVPFMMLENCCYGKVETTVTRMVREGLLGEIVHCEGGYRHDLRWEIANGEKNRHYRLEEYKNRNCENYPTHEIGPIAKLLGINSGNRFVSLVSVASKAAGMTEYLKANKPEMADTKFAQGDIVTTTIKCHNGETVTITLDTTLPRFYSRDFAVCGTKGMFDERTNSVFLDNGDFNKYHFNWQPQWDNLKEVGKDYIHPLWDDNGKEAISASGSHANIDMFVLEAFFDSLEKGSPMPIDVYDAATWMAITALSEKSIAEGSIPVEFPDFTNGKWQQKKHPTGSVYFLD